MILSLIVAVSENGVIGRAGDIPWTIPADMRHFKAATLGKPVIMGRKTWDSLPGRLPGRTNIVITRNESFHEDGVIRAASFEDACAIAQSQVQGLEQEQGQGQEKTGEIMVIGGAGVYRLALPHADRVYLTRVHGTIDGDTYFPDLDPAAWVERSREYVAKTGKASHDCTFILLERNRT